MSEQTVWHYTDSAGALGILSTNSLWATSLQHLNDTSELDYGLEVVTAELNKRTQQEAAVAKKFLALVRGELEQERFRDRFFVACASMIEDDLSQWRAYGRSGGYSIGLNVDSHVRWGGVLTSGSQDAPPRMTLSSRFMRLGEWRAVKYDVADQGQSACHALDSACESAAEAMAPATSEPRREELLMIHAGYLVVAATLCKYSGFAAENEVRLVVADPGVPGCIRFRPGPFGVTPYLAVTPAPRGTAESIGEFVTEQPGNLALFGVKVGPSSEPHSAQNGMERLLTETGHSGCAVDLSATPYRSP